MTEDNSLIKPLKIPLITQNDTITMIAISKGFIAPLYLAAILTHALTKNIYK
jgi:hypothetical protein